MYAGHQLNPLNIVTHTKPYPGLFDRYPRTHNQVKFHELG